ncbi:MAG TPA: CBS domain-containing protein [Acidilobales archaeon]|nr:CBS domain-containing protein [Acidilobales archaeon]
MPILRRKRKFPIRVEDLMSTPPIVIKRDTTIEEAAKIMGENNIGSLMIVNEEGALEGIVTERDMIYAIAENKVGKGLPIWTIMTENPITIKPKALITEAVKIMRDANIRHLPVVDEGNKPIGMLSLRDIIDAIVTLIQIFFVYE